MAQTPFSEKLKLLLWFSLVQGDWCWQDVWTICYGCNKEVKSQIINQISGFIKKYAKTITLSY